MDWDHFWAWTGDSTVWDWVRTAVAALFGAVVGGLFTLIGQSRAAKTQRGLQRGQLEAAALADESRWNREQQEAALTHSLESAHELLEGFTSLQRAVQAAAPSISDYLNGTSWKPTWKTIWTEDVSLDLDVRARLLADERVSLEIERIVRLLDAASSISIEQSGSPSPFLRMRLREIAGHLTAEGIEVVASYIRRRPHKSKRTEFLDTLDAVRADYEAWEAREMEAAENYEPDDAPIPGDEASRA